MREMTRARPDELSSEQVRILRAIEDGRFSVNRAGRYVIAGEPRPDRRERERLFKRGLVLEAWGRPGRADALRWKLSARGHAVLHSHLDREPVSS